MRRSSKETIKLREHSQKKKIGPFSLPPQLGDGDVSSVLTVHTVKLPVRKRRAAATSLETDAAC